MDSYELEYPWDQFPSDEKKWKICVNNYVYLRNSNRRLDKQRTETQRFFSSINLPDKHITNESLKYK